VSRRVKPTFEDFMPDLDTTLKRLFADIFDIDADEFCDELSYEDTPDWDSLGHMQMVSALAKEFGVEFDIEEVMAMETVARIKEIIAAKL
jgi:acyl carrier protein